MIKKTAEKKKTPIKKESKQEIANVIAPTPTTRRRLSQQFAPLMEPFLLPPRVVMQIADEVAERLKRRRTEKKPAQKGKIEKPLFLDTSAIIDERLYSLVKMGVFYGNLIVLDGVLSELKHIADIKDDVKKERGRRALKRLDQIKKMPDVKLTVLKDIDSKKPVDDRIIEAAKKHKGRIITCDFNLSQKAKISGVISIDIHELANAVKTQAIPGETFFVKVIQTGKGEGQGVGYLPDGTMIVVEQGSNLIGKTIQVTVSRIIQTEAGKILFSKILP